MYVNLNKDTGVLELNLPKEAEEYKNEILHDLMEEYAFEAINKEALDEMNNYVINWFKGKGIELGEDL